MQTFMPEPDFVKTAECLDTKRLGNQRNEALVILRTVLGLSEGWARHPACRMWAGHAHALAVYGEVICEVFRLRGYRDTLMPVFHAYAMDLPMSNLPHWVGVDAFHRSHQSNLVRKLPSHYRQYWPEIPDDLPYVWPKGEK